jgi:hypothetical protein
MNNNHINMHTFKAIKTVCIVDLSGRKRNEAGSSLFEFVIFEFLFIIIKVLQFFCFSIRVYAHIFGQMIQVKYDDRAM